MMLVFLGGLGSGFALMTTGEIEDWGNRERRIPPGEGLLWIHGFILGGGRFLLA